MNEDIKTVELNEEELNEETEVIVPFREKYFDPFIDKTFRIGSIKLQVVDILFIICILVMGLIARIKLYPIVSADFWGFLDLWMQEIKALGGFPSLAKEISNYTSPYMYLMCIVSGFDNTLYALKTLSVIFDYSAAFAVFMIVHEITKDTKKAVLGMAILLMSPTVLIDSAYWCQCDIMYTSFILWAVYFLIKDNSKCCLIFVGIAFAFKLQTLFIVPLLLIMWLKKKTVKLLDFVYVPAIFIIAQLPACLFGRPFEDLMLIYFRQTNSYPWGTLNYPNLYNFLDETMKSEHHMYEVSGAGTILAVMFLGFMAYYLYGKNIEFNSDMIITLALFLVGTTVYVLPHMHDRYGFLVDLFAIVYAVNKPKRIPIMCGFMLVSTCVFMPYMIAVDIFDMKILALAQLILLIFVGYDLYKQINNSTQKPNCQTI